MAAVEVSQLSYSYGKTRALHDVELTVPEGALYALLGPNGSGKTTLLQLLMGLRRPQAGRISLFGTAASALGTSDRSRIGYVAERQPLPAWMRLSQLESYLAPFYPTWDRALVTDLRDRFQLDPQRRIGTLSRGEHMKAALLCALAPRPKLLLMDEPFTGMDVLVKDDLVRGLLATSGSEGWTVIISSHDIGELELLANWAGFLAHGRLQVSEPMEQLMGRFKRVSIVLGDPALGEQRPGDEWLSVERAGHRLSFVVPNGGDEYTQRVLAPRFAGARQVELRDATLREIFVALARRPASKVQEAVAA
jgi:ABC-2 type transport system ATP-binding protein